ncbi:hypothetical protein DBR32_03930 [Taibaiella sp. KBW10]|uniref:hypothetical protein n=1 Tax=Taibaiella sp. KBW10 TaxID=2153357 RepID=UPI000F5A653A|nr:hypothetical protein [Taibaiella sp. KBW10]RQO31961.1 hypothetical protein DBR32_03930 [Taibaiella sp. KBW10]
MKNMLLLLLCLIVLNPQATPQNHKQARPAETVRAFVKWYGTHWEKCSSLETNTINMGVLALKEKEENPPYSINFKGVEAYIGALSETGFFSEKYFETLRNWFKDADHNFKENPQNDGPPEGFQYDRFFLTQEDFLKDIKNIDKIAINEKLLDHNTADVRMHFPYCNITYHYLLSNKNGKWYINAIQNIPFNCRLPKK